MAREGTNVIQQIGAQTVAGTAVPAVGRFASLGIDLGYEITSKQFRSRGAKTNTTSIVHKKMVTGTFEGPLSYVELVWILAGMNPASVVTTTGVSVWTIAPNPIGADTFRYMTLESGDDEQVEQYVDMQFNSLDISWGLEDVNVSGAVFAKPRTIMGGGLTPALPMFSEVPVSARDITIYCDPSFATIGTTAMGDPFDAKISLGEKFSPKWVLNKAQTTYKESFEKIPDKTFTLTIEANSEGRTLLADLIDNNSGKFFQVEAKGINIPGGTPSTPYTIQFQFYAKLTSVREQKDYQDALFAYELTFTMVQESTLNAPYKVIIKNALTSALAGFGA